jgi:hypothetical protein
MGGADRPLRRGGDCSPLSAVRSKSKSYPLTPTLSPKGARGKGSRSSCFSRPEFGSISQAGEGKGSRSSCFSRSEFGSISQAGEGEREQIFMLFKIRVRLDISSWRGGKGADLHAFQDPSSARYLKLARGKGADLHAFQCRSSTQDVQVGVPRTSTSVSPLSLWERARVRGFLFFSF